MLKRGRPIDLIARNKAMELRLKGLSYTEIGKNLSVSRQRAQQLTRPSAEVYRQVRERVDSKCELCGVTLRSGHVHHKRVEGSLDYNDLDNLMYLCISCHRIVHPGNGSKGGPPDWLVKFEEEYRKKVLDNS